MAQGKGPEMAADNGFTEVTETEDEWNEVSGESQIKLENEGEGWIGTFDGMSNETSGMVQAHFLSAKDLEGNEIGDCFIVAGKDLQNKLRNVPAKTLVKCQWVDSMDTGQKLPMRVFKVWSKR
jgi:hypothetical protein